MTPPDPEAGSRAPETPYEIAARKGRSRPGTTKDAVRARIQAARAAHPDRAGADAARLAHLLAVSDGHDTVAVYGSIGAEPDTWSLIDTLHARGVRVLLPVLRGPSSPAWGVYAGAGSLVAGWRGVRQPTGTALGPDALASASLVWVSALAASPSGARLGTGGGWYDRALTWASADAVIATLVGEDELFDELPVDPWDVPVDVIVTPSGVLWTDVGRPPSGPATGEQSRAPER